MTDRRTIAASVTLEGVGLHLGQPCRLTFVPAPSGTGLRFRRTDLPGAPETPVHVGVAVAAERRTQLGEGAAALHTVEHVLAAVAGLSIDDLIIGMDGPEPPILDGSAEPFRAALVGAGIVSQQGAPTILRLREPVRVVPTISDASRTMVFSADAPRMSPFARRSSTHDNSPKVRAGASSSANVCGVTVQRPDCAPIRGWGKSIATSNSSASAGVAT